MGEPGPVYREAPHVRICPRLGGRRPASTLYTFPAAHSTSDTLNSATLCSCFSRAHDSDVKEANKQKCQQPGQQPSQQQQQGQAVYHGSGQTAAVAQYLHRPSMQYPQQAPQPGLASNHRPASYLSHSTTGLQAPNGPQHGNTQAITTSLDPKASRAYQVSMHYTCAAPCFDR